MQVRALPAPLSWRMVWWFVNTIGALVLVRVWVELQLWPFIGSAGAYYSAALGPDLYSRTWNVDPAAYVYPPPFRQIIEPLTWLEWPAFYAVWTGLLTMILAWLVSPIVAAVLMTPGLEPFWHSVATGDVALLMAAALVMRPAWWSVLPLLKVTPGVAFLWFALRREWRSLTIALATSVGVVLVSLALGPQMWIDWIGLMLRSTDAPLIGLNIPVAARVLPGALIVALAAWRGWRWMLPIGVLIAMPNLTWTSLVVLAAVPRLVDRVEAEPAEVDSEAGRVDPHEQRVFVVGRQRAGG